MGSGDFRPGNTDKIDLSF